MPPIPRPRPGFLDSDEVEYLGSYGGQQRWRRRDRRRLYTWDWTKGEIEVFDRRGNHLGAADGVTGEMTKPARKGRKIDV